MALKKTFLSEEDIQRLERLPKPDLLERLRGMTGSTLVQLFAEMLQSYRLAARVANAALRAFSLPDPDAATQLERCLADYAESHVTRHGGDLEVLCDELSFLLEDTADFSADEIRTLVEERLQDYRLQLQKLHAQKGDQLSMLPNT